MRIGLLMPMLSIYSLNVTVLCLESQRRQLHSSLKILQNKQKGIPLHCHCLFEWVIVTDLSLRFDSAFLRLLSVVVIAEAKRYDIQAKNYIFGWSVCDIQKRKILLNFSRCSYKLFKPNITQRFTEVKGVEFVYHNPATKVTSCRVNNELRYLNNFIPYRRSLANDGRHE